eukprot:TRINITY_DN11477_c0_g1_i6.p5 TRINITY_DN11477_c0_g1~~TRINITY_DN11477_c0_g1_i6.p5  ORF type:complete len:131 (-),score=19.57 TRINITY_DN11477_c0_g1_i6:1411-1803(-)
MEANLPSKASPEEPPKPTNFSNSRSQIYLTHNSGLCGKGRRKGIKGGVKVGLEESKGKVCGGVRQPEKTAFGPLHIQQAGKLEPKRLPIGNESFIEAAIVSAVRESSESELSSGIHSTVQYQRRQTQTSS